MLEGGLKLVPGVGVADGAVLNALPPPPAALVCTPSLSGTPTLEYQVSLMETITRCMQMGIIVDAAFVRGDCFIGKARNNLIMQARNRRAENIFFIDDDEGWNSDAFIRMLLDPHEIVAGAVPKKMDEVTFNNCDLITDAMKNCTVEGGLLKVRTVGTGFMRIKKSALERYIAAYPETYNPGDGSQLLHHRVFEPGGKILDGQFWGEDLVFCKAWEAIGGEMWIDPNVNFAHVGRKTWSGNFLNYLQANCKVQLAQQPAVAAAA